MNDIRLQALEAARPFSHNIDDLMANAERIEQYLSGEVLLNTTALTPIERRLPLHAPEIDEIADLAGIVADTAVHVHPDEKLREIVESITPGSLDGPTQPLYADGFNPEDFLVERYRITGPRLTDDDHLRPMWIKIAEQAREHDIVINSSRGAGLTTFMIAFARERAAQGKHVMLLTSNYRQVVALTKEIDDTSVRIMTFETATKTGYAGEYFDYILIDNAANIPFALEHTLMTYIHSAARKELIAPFDHDDVAERSAGRTSHYHAGSSILVTPPYLIVGSVPASEEGLFHHLWEQDDCALKIAVAAKDWMHENQLAGVKTTFGPDRFNNLYNNAFRPVQE